LSTSVKAKNHRLEDLGKQRDGALAQQEFNQAVSSLVQSPHQLQLLAEVNTCLSAFTFMILDWQYQHGQLSLLLQQENLDSRALIEACSKSPLFTDVRAEPGSSPNQTRLLLALPVVAKEANNAE
jgi:hypothetical protein